MSKQKGRNRSNHTKSPPRDISSREPANAPYWLWGVHAVQAAAANPKRAHLRVLATVNAARRVGLAEAEACTGAELERLLPPGAVHQGVAMQVRPLPLCGLDAILSARPRCVAVLDQVSDPHNLGAIFRSAAAFGVSAVIMQTRHAPPITGVVAKSAAGAVERVDECRVVNIARTLETLGDAGYCTIGLAGEADAALAAVIPADVPLALVLGAEGSGLRPAVAKACTWLAHIPISQEVESLNVSNAAAIAFYEAARTGSF